MTDTKAQIAFELVNALRRLGAKQDLLEPLGSYHDTMEDEGVMRRLWKRNEALGLGGDRLGTPDVEGGIQQEIMIAARGLDAPTELLRIIDSWGGGQADEEVLRLLRKWNQRER
ncbi:hypothetical protein SAZ10_32725 [Mesorhizobium sp. BAC0120]|uniref:hypothetical protein n=1 Tax=Mesorhizobium sp. BAC0120 TaxID=3090670 RepID=UPI00298C4F2D|nr:hypothetical protein [Mesorhizobium sp. BAC0120]MDW6026535.1 hypothetical protein [Mesorhizobium sp. BAC0120]